MLRFIAEMNSQKRKQKAMYEGLPIDYRARQKRTFELIEGGAILVPAMPEAKRNSDVHHPYRQSSFVHYLCGFAEQETTLLLVNISGVKKSYAFVRPRDPIAELWEGKRLGPEGAVSALNVDEAFAITELWVQLPKLIKGVDKLYFTFGVDEHADLRVISSLKQERRLRGRSTYGSYVPVFDADHIAGQLRLIKDPVELERMRRAAAITAKGFAAVRQQLVPGMNERQVHGILLGEFLGNGAEMEAYPSIVAGGVNACCLHYRANDQALKAGELLLIDAGCQFQYYASDVTRTFPIGGRFGGEQRVLYEAVLDAQLLGISLSRVGQTIESIHSAICRRLTEHLVELKLLKGSIDELIAQNGFKKFYPHGSGHWLGMDVHDVGDYLNEDAKPRPLQAGMVFTVEPGIYIDPNEQTVDEAWRGIGIRIEDDVVVTPAEPEVLTAMIPKTVADLEQSA